MSNQPLPLRRVRFAYPDDMDPAWIPGRPEFAAMANGLSLLMPYAEPLFIQAVRACLDELDPAHRARVEDYIRQEVGHHREHARFNEIIRARHPRVARVERWMKRCAQWVTRTRSRRYNVAFSAGGEIMSFLLARWVDEHSGDLFADADPLATTLFLWHLSEEVEHKSVAFDVYEAIDGSKLRYAAAMVQGTALLGFFVWAAALVMLRDDGRLWRPMTHLRLARWAISAAFELFPAMLVSALPGHHPNDFTDPLYLSTLLRQYDPETRTMPLWQSPGRTAA